MLQFDFCAFNLKLELYTQYCGDQKVDLFLNLLSINKLPMTVCHRLLIRCSPHSGYDQPY